ncbi:hypothetical protein [Parvimonas sp. C2]|uniref:hypothetical protein n=1 Tax=Parvimonas sp. C2 TaxID=3110692 RepID=UPI002B46D410|nr:hypothetical protein [Parvimonas sp. C2]MEB3073106.1 hypothetical protein [Parvimonas sp. C2]
MKKIYIIGLVIILIGGVFMAFSLNGNRAKHKEEFRERQDRIALYFVNNYELTNGEKIKEIKITNYRKNYMTGIWDCILLINGKYYADVSEIYETKEIAGARYHGEEFKRVKPPKNNTKLEANIEYFED